MRASILSAVLLAAPALAGAASTCHGLVHMGRIDGAVKLPQDGPNFYAYSSMAALAGRTYVHSEVAAIVLGAYGALQSALPGTVFVYGETGGVRGGLFKPHRTHQNGLSVDFFVPVRDAAGRSVPLPTPATSRFGYDIEFDAQGRYGAYRIDFPALAEHLFHLDTAARARGLGLAKVIIDPRYETSFCSTPRAAPI